MVRTTRGFMPIASICSIVLLGYIGFAVNSSAQPQQSTSSHKMSTDSTDTSRLIKSTSSTETEDSEDYSPYECILVEKEPYTDIKELKKKLVYPDLAKRARIEGRINVRILVGKNGIPRKHIIESSDSDLLNDAAVRAVMSLVFTPAIQNNQPIDCWVSIPVIFRLP